MGAIPLKKRNDLDDFGSILGNLHLGELLN